MAMAGAVGARHLAKRTTPAVTAVVMNTQAARMIAGAVVAATNTRVAEMAAGEALDWAG